jgi:hypothetical protein
VSAPLCRLPTTLNKAVHTFKTLGNASARHATATASLGVSACASELIGRWYEAPTFGVHRDLRREPSSPARADRGHHRPSSFGPVRPADPDQPTPRLCGTYVLGVDNEASTRPSSVDRPAAMSTVQCAHCCLRHRRSPAGRTIGGTLSGAELNRPRGWIIRPWPGRTTARAARCLAV